MLHEEYLKSTVGEDREVPLDALGSPPQTEMGSCLYSGPSTDIADTVSLPYVLIWIRYFTQWFYPV